MLLFLINLDRIWCIDPKQNPLVTQFDGEVAYQGRGAADRSEYYCRKGVFSFFSGGAFIRDGITAKADLRRKLAGILSCQRKWDRRCAAKRDGTLLAAVAITVNPGARTTLTQPDSETRNVVVKPGAVLGAIQG